VAPGGEREEEQAAEDADAERQDVEHLRRLLGRRRPAEAPDDVLVPGGHDREHGGGERGVDEVDEGEPVPGGVHRGRVVVEQPEAPGRGDAVADAAVGGPDGVGEGGERAGEGQEAAREQRRRRRRGW
jgi:hypothetical protein